jgi:hypothetical protein
VLSTVALTLGGALSYASTLLWLAVSDGSSTTRCSNKFASGEALVADSLTPGVDFGIMGRNISITDSRVRMKCACPQSEATDSGLPPHLLSYPMVALPCLDSLSQLQHERLGNLHARFVDLRDELSKADEVVDLDVISTCDQFSRTSVA